MYLSDRDLEYAVKTNQLIIVPPPTEYDTTSIDLHLDKVAEAKIWDHQAFEKQQRSCGHEWPWVRVGTFDHEAFSRQFHKDIPEDDQQQVFRSGNLVIVKPGGFFLWQTKEQVGTPEDDPRLICFIDGKSTKARTGMLVHMTAPTIHAGWWGNVTLEIKNLGPFTLALKEGDAIVQIVVATISSRPAKKKKAKGVAVGQCNVAGEAS